MTFYTASRKSCATNATQSEQRIKQKKDTESNRIFLTPPKLQTIKPTMNNSIRLIDKALSEINKPPSRPISKEYVNSLLLDLRNTVEFKTNNKEK